MRGSKNLSGAASADSREFDVIVYGATTYTGNFICNYFMQTYGPPGTSLRWAIAGKNRSRLEKLKARLLKTIRREIGETEVKENELDIIQVDRNERTEDFHEMCERTKVVVTTDLGPCSKSGVPLIKACVSTGCDYINASAETLWSHKVISLFQEESVENNARVVVACGGFTGLADLGVLHLSSHLPIGVRPKFDHYIGPTKASFNARSIAALIYMFEPEFKVDPKLFYKAFSNPRILNFSSNKNTEKHSDPKLPTYSRLLSRWTCPFLMAPLNARMVHRSDEFNRYGPDFQYNEYVVLESVLSMFLYALFYCVYLGALSFPPTRVIIKKYIVDTKKVPRQDSLSNGSYASTIVVKDSNAVNNYYTCSVSLNHGDVMFKGTAAMMAEAAFLLASSHGDSGGVYTPASCPGLGSKLIETLNTTTNMEFDFTVEGDLSRNQVSRRVQSAG